MEDGQIVLLRFPQANLYAGKVRPALLLTSVPGPFDDWLICMVSSRLDTRVTGFDELLTVSDVDFPESGLRRPSVIRIGRLAVAEKSVLLGAIGAISSERLLRIRDRLGRWLRRSID